MGPGRRRSLLLVSLAHQVRLVELPWAAPLLALATGGDAPVRAVRAAAETLHLVVSASLQHFPMTALPNKLPQSLRELLRAAEHLGMRPVCERGVDAMFENVDADHNQRISFDEFRALVERWRKDM